VPKLRGANENPVRSVPLRRWTSVVKSKQSLAFDFRCFRSNLRFEGWKRNFRPCRIFSTLQNANWTKNKENGQRLLFCFPAHAKQVRGSVTKMGGPLPVCKNGCEASLKQDFFYCVQGILMRLLLMSSVECLLTRQPH